MRAPTRLALSLALACVTLAGCGATGPTVRECIHAFSARWRSRAPTPPAHPAGCEARWQQDLDAATAGPPAEGLRWLETVSGSAPPRGPSCDATPPARSRAAAWPPYAERHRALCTTWTSEVVARPGFAKARARAAEGNLMLAVWQVLSPGEEEGRGDELALRQAAFLDEVLSSWLPQLAAKVPLKNIEELRALAAPRWHPELDAARCDGARARLEAALATPPAWDAHSIGRAQELDRHLAVCAAPGDERAQAAERLAAEALAEVASQADEVARQERAVTLAGYLPDAPIAAPARAALAPLVEAREARLEATRRELLARADALRRSGQLLAAAAVAKAELFPPADRTRLHTEATARYLADDLGVGQRLLRVDLLRGAGVPAPDAPEGALRLNLGGCEMWRAALTPRLERLTRPGLMLTFSASECSLVKVTAEVATGRSFTAQGAPTTICVAMDKNRNCTRSEVRMETRKVAVTDEVTSVSASLAGTLEVAGLGRPESVALRFGRPPPAGPTAIPSAVESTRAMNTALSGPDGEARTAVDRVASQSDAAAWLAAATGASTAAEREDRAALAARRGARLPERLIAAVAKDLGVAIDALPAWFRGER